MMKITTAFIGILIFSSRCVSGHHDETISPAPTETAVPSPSPSEVPSTSLRPSVSWAPSVTPTNYPTTSNPTNAPTDLPTESPAPSPSPSDIPTSAPSDHPTTSQHPTSSGAPSLLPSSSPTIAPTSAPSNAPTDVPSVVPTPNPTSSFRPTVSPTITANPTRTPQPTTSPSNGPTDVPTSSPAPTSSSMPSSTPSDMPTDVPSSSPSFAPSGTPTASNAPSLVPSASPTTPQPSAIPTDQPSTIPSGAPTSSSAPSQGPTVTPQPSDSSAPSYGPSPIPTAGERRATVEHVKLTFQNMTGEIEGSDIKYFQEQCKEFLNQNFPLPNQVSRLNFDAVAIVSQSLGVQTTDKGGGRTRNLSELFPLEITIRLWVTIYPGDPDGLDLHDLLSDYFADPSVIEGFRDDLNQLSTFFMSSSMGGSRRNSSKRSSSRSFPSAAYGAISGVLMSMTGAVLFTIWYRKRRIFSADGGSVSNWGFKYRDNISRSMNSTNPTDESRDMGGFLPSSNSGESAGNSQIHHQFSEGSIYPLQSIEASLIVEPGVRSYGQNGRKPALIQFETNIEVPPTPAPGTATPAHYDLSQFDPEDPALGAFNGSKTDMELKRIFQSWNAEVNGSSNSEQKSSSGSNSTDTGKDGSIVMPPNGKSLSGSRHTTMEGESVDFQGHFNSFGTFEVRENLQTDDGFNFHEDMHSVKRRRSGLASVSKLFRRTLSSERRRQNRNPYSPAHGHSVAASTLTSVISEAGNTTIEDAYATAQRSRIGMSPNAGAMQFATMDELGHSWLSQQESILSFNDNNGSTEVQITAGSNVRQWGQHPPDRNPRRAGRLPPTYVGARWENRTGYYPSNTTGNHGGH